MSRTSTSEHTRENPVTTTNETDSNTPSSAPRRGPIAVVGVSALMPGSIDKRGFWAHEGAAGRQVADEFVSQQIDTDTNVCLVSRDHPAVGDQLTLEQYAGLRHIILRAPPGYGPSLIDRELWSHGLKREHAMTVHSFFEFPRIISTTDMIGSVPTRIAKSLAQVHNLRIVPAPIEFEMPVYLTWPQSLHGDPGHRWLREFLTEIYRGL